MRAFLVLALALAGCATHSAAPSQYYRAVGATDQLAISGTLRQRPGFMTRDMNNQVAIMINGQQVAGGTFTGGALELAGSYDGKPVTVDCSAIASGGFSFSTNPTNVKCLVFIAGDRAASLLLAP